jgi:2-methylcitrate dehydratase PrpD
MMSITETMAKFAVATPSDAIPQDVKLRALALATDLIGSATRAAQEADSSPSILAMLSRMGMDGAGDCTVFGLNRRYPPAAAALLNGAFGHSLDFDDTHSDSSLHPSAPVVPAAFAAAEMTGASGDELLAAIVVGFEICCRLGVALDPSAHYARGFHPTATAGTFGAAAAAGRLFGLSVESMISAYGVAASQASGSLQFLVNGAWNKRYQVGEASMKGLIAATLASEGFTGAIESVDGKHGFLGSYSDGANPARAVEALSTVWETMKIGLKPYPACRYVHAAVDGLLQLQNEHKFSAQDVDSISVGLHRNGITLVGAPLDQKRRARTIVDGQFSMPFAASIALLYGQFGWDDYVHLGRPEVDALADRVLVFRDTSLEDLRHPFGATLQVCAAGKSYALRIPDPSGEPDTFPQASDLAAKFKTLAGPVLNAGSDELFQKLQSIPTAANIRHLFS